MNIKKTYKYLILLIIFLVIFFLDRISKIQKLSKNLNQGHLQSVAQRIQTTKKESASEKWISDFKELLNMAGEGLSTIYINKRIYKKLLSWN